MLKLQLLYDHNVVSITKTVVGAQGWRELPPCLPIHPPPPPPPPEIEPGLARSDVSPCYMDCISVIIFMHGVRWGPRGSESLMKPESSGSEWFSIQWLYL